VRVTGAPAVVLCARIESVVKQWAEPLDIVTARALAPLPALCAFVEPLLERGAIAVFHKGRAFDTEIRAARQIWDIDLVEHESRAGEGTLVEIRRLQRRDRR
jgi:16S rRNA (guanine527-N7)-methyltransferase